METPQSSAQVDTVRTTGLSTAEGTQRKMHRKQQTSHAHATVHIDGEGGTVSLQTVLLVHTDQDAKHLEPVDNKRKHSAKPATPAIDKPLL